MHEPDCYDLPGVRMSRCEDAKGSRIGLPGQLIRDLAPKIHNKCTKIRYAVARTAEISPNILKQIHILISYADGRLDPTVLASFLTPSPWPG